MSSDQSSANNPVPNFYRASAADFRKIPGSPIAYWASPQLTKSFDNGILIGDIADVSEGIKTGDNGKFLRFWYEIAIANTSFSATPENILDESNNVKWFPHHKGGGYRRWYGNLDFVINWKDNGQKIKESPNSGLQGKEHYFWDGITWSKLSSSYFGVRYLPQGVLFDSGSPAVFLKNREKTFPILSFLLSKVSTKIVKMTNPTLNFQVGNISNLPLCKCLDEDKINLSATIIVDISKSDWDSYETSWDFTTVPLLRPEYRQDTLKETYTTLLTHWHETTLEMQRLEEENNRIFIEAYGLQDELTPDVSLSEITLTCNPHYRYKGNKTEEELEKLLLTDTIKEFISYAVGCMFGRYSLDKPGLVLANQGETVEDYLEKVPNPPSFMPDDDNIIPILDDEYFTDDIVTRFKDFLKITFGKENFSQNLEFIARALSGKSSGSPDKTIRDYFIRDFYKDHVKKYKKRPIYWQFSSGRNQGFNAVIYMHRYDRATLAKMRTDYLLELESKLDARLKMLSEDPAKNKAKIATIRKQIEELKGYDELLNNKALALIEIDLDDGVVVNYAKFEGLVKKI